jgi:hypothetical protein
VAPKRENVFPLAAKYLPRYEVGKGVHSSFVIHHLSLVIGHSSPVNLSFVIAICRRIKSWR